MTDLWLIEFTAFAVGILALLWLDAYQQRQGMAVRAEQTRRICRGGEDE